MKKKILFILPRYSEIDGDSTLEKELVLEFFNQGNDVTVASLLERSEKKETYLKKISGVDVLKIKCGNYYSKGTTKYEKALTLLSIPFLFKKNILQKINKKIDLIILSTPMMNSYSLISALKDNYNCDVLLIVWDIFPQNAVDLKMIKSKLLIKYFTKKYKKALESADYITAMSKGNKEYLSDKFQTKKEKIFVLKNWAKIKSVLNINKKEIREKYGYKEEDFISIFGGNMGKPQKLENLLKLAEKLKSKKNVKFLFVGSGTEKERLEKISNEKELKNVKFINQIPREDYELLTGSCDLGLVSLDERFTVPNFPSKTTDYFKLGLPILASLDKCSANDYGVLLEGEAKAGLYALANDTDELYNKFIEIHSNEEKRREFSINGRKYYEKELSVEKAYETIIKKINKML